MKKIIASLLIVTMIYNMFTYTELGVAKASKNEISNKKEEIKDYQNKLEQTKKDRKQIEAEAAKLDLEVEASEKKLKELTSRITVLEKDNKSIQEEIKKSQIKMDENYKIMADIIKIEYEQQSVGYISLLLESKSFSNFLRRVEVVFGLIKNNDKVINETKTLEKNLTVKKATLESQINEFEAKKVEATKENANLQALKIKKKSEIDKLILAQGQISSDIKLSQNQLDELESSREELEQEIKPNPGGGSTGGGSTGGGSTGGGSTGGGSTGGGDQQGGNFTWPVPGHKYISSKFGYRKHPISGQMKLHSGIDIPAPAGTPVVAASSGKVVMSKYHNAYGNFIAVDHGGGVVSYYAHNTERLVSVGDTVSKGQKIATVGTTGYSTGNHLHFEIKKNGQFVDPEGYL
ncbi:MAG: peptidoglycan DD-metalloendopeptidase family protein [Clostridium sp.]